MPTKSKYFPAGIIFVLAIVHSAIFLSFFNDTNMGHDYSLFLPQLLNGVFHSIQNGIFSIPWFSPAICGGVPFFADLNNLYYSVPQFLSFFINPVGALKLTFFIFSFLGGFGFYKLLKEKFEVSQELSLLGSMLFMFNSLYATRIIIGHLTFHSFMLVPWIAYALLPTDSECWSKRIKLSLISSLAISYIFYSGGVNLILPIAIIIVLLIIMKLISSEFRIPFERYALTVLFTFSMCFSKLYASLSLMKSFPRDFYKLPGWNSLYHVISNLMISLFGHLSKAQAAMGYTNFQFGLGEHEIEYSVGLIPLIAILVFLFKNGKPFIKELKQLNKIKISYVAIFVILLLTPIFFNLYSSGWNSFLKTLPIIKNTSLMVRWFAIYIPIIIAISILALKKMTLSKNVIQAVAFGGMFIVLLQTIIWDKGYYKKQGYQSRPVTQMWNYATANKKIVPISKNGKKRVGNILFLQGESNLMCYQPFFGYRLEKFPKKSIAEGNIEFSDGNNLNFKNPACYVFPEENNCQVGDHFKPSQINQLRLLAQYKSYEFKVPGIQSFANVLSFLMVTLSILILLILKFRQEKQAN